MNDPVHNPAHYTEGAIECIDAIESATAGLEGFEAFLTGQVMKYMWRWKKKNGTQDLEKAEWYLQRLIDIQPQELQVLAPATKPDSPKALDPDRTPPVPTFSVYPWNHAQAAIP